MLYDYPPIRWNDPQSSIWSGILVSFSGLSLLLVVSAAIYLFRAWRGRPSTLGMLLFWVLGGLLELGLFVVIAAATRNASNLPFAFGVGLVAGICALLSLLHCSVALSTQNVRVREQAQTVATCLMMLGAAGLMGLMSVPATRNAREASRRTQCKNNLKQIGLAFHNFHDARNKFADAIVREGDQRPPRSWRIELLPYIDQAPLYYKYDMTKRWDDSPNLEFSKTEIRTYQCPSLPREEWKNEQGQYYSAYAVVMGDHTIFSQGRGLSMGKITDGTSQTVLVVEACGQEIIWSKPQDIELTTQNLGINLPGTRPQYSPGIWSSHHAAGAHMLLADGSVRFISKNTNPKVLQALLSANQGEKIGDY